MSETEKQPTQEETIAQNELAEGELESVAGGTSIGILPLIITVPIVYYAITHYTRLVLHEDRGEEPDQILLRDRTIQVSIVLWLVCFIAIFYGHVTLFR